MKQRMEAALVAGVTGVTGRCGFYLADFLQKSACDLQGSERRAG